MRAAYDSDISKEKFEEILPPAAKRTQAHAKPTTLDLHEVFCAALYLLRTGCQWTMLPREFTK